MVASSIAIPVTRAGRSVATVTWRGSGARPTLVTPSGDGAAAVLDEELGDAVGGCLRDRRVDAALEPLRRLAGQLVPAWVRNIDTGSKCAASITTWVVVADSSVVCAAHDTGEPDRAAVVGDQQVLDGQLALDAVEGGQPLALARPTHPDRTRELVAVVAVDRLPELEHHVVGDVDGQRDRPHAGQLDADARATTGSAQPGRSR